MILKSSYKFKPLYSLLFIETSVALHSQEDLWPGVYELQVKVSDEQGLSCPADEVFRVDVCTCVDTEDCNILQRAARLETTSSELSAPAIGLLLMAMCLLLCELSSSGSSDTHYCHNI